MTVNAKNILDKIYPNEKAKKKLIISIMNKLEVHFKKELENLTEAEKAALVLQIVGLEKTIDNIINNGIDMEKLNKIKKIINDSQVM